jgi:hypothetical protein
MSRGRAASLLFALALLTLLVLAVADHAAWAQFGPPQGGPPGGAQCNSFQALAEEAQKKGSAVGAAIKAKVDRKQICALMTTFVAAESNVIKFLDDNKVWCGVPEQVITVSKANHEKSIKFRTEACSDDGPHPKVPTLSDAIKEPSGVDTEKNTKTGRGTFDTLTGNPLAK